MLEVVGTFSSTELRDKRANRSVEIGNGASGGFTQHRFEFAVGHFDGIEIGGISRQVANRGPRLFNRFLDAGDLVRGVVVQDDNIVAPKGWHQDLLHIGQEYLAIDGTLDHHGRNHLVVTQRGDEGDRLPFSERDVADQSNASRSTSFKAHQIGAHRGFVDKYQPSRVKHTLLSHPASTRADHVRSLPFGSLQAFF